MKEHSLEGALSGTRKTSFTATTALEKFEEFIQGIENTQNDFVDGVDRDMIPCCYEYCYIWRIKKLY